MKSGEWQKVKTIFDNALRQKPEDRPKFIKQICGSDKVLLKEIETLLASLEDAESFMETPAIEEVAELIENDARLPEFGKSLGHYKIIKVIGSGGMGEVYLARDEKLDRQVAVKILNEKFSQNESDLQRFIKEAKAASSLNHPNILVIHEIGKSENADFIISEYIEGKTLREIIKSSPMNLNEILDISIQIANALSTAHQAHIIHRDIKPENIIVRPDGYVKILDFGLAKLFGEKAFDFEGGGVKKNETGKGIILGTVNYMSPEQARGEKIDPRTDIFSLGIVIYEMLTGETPFQGNSTPETFANLINREPALSPTYLSNTPARLREIISKTLVKDKEIRYQNMNQVFKDLADLHEQLKFAEKMRTLQYPDYEIDKNETKKNLGFTGEIEIQTVSTFAYSAGTLKKHRKLIIAGLFAGLILSILGFAFFIYLKQNKADAYFSRINLNRLTNSGKIDDVVLSPDGNYIAFSTEEKSGLSLSVRQVGMSNTINLLPPQKGYFSGLTFSPDGRFIYYSLLADKSDPECFSIPALGGPARKIPGMSAQAMVFAPNGKQYLYLNSFTETGEKVLGLFIGNLDGGEDIKLAERKSPASFSAGGQSYAWSPDGKTIAIISNERQAEGEFSTLVGISAADGSERPLSEKHWDYLDSVQWMKDGNGLLVAGSDKPQSPSQLWFVSTTGSERKLTNDLNNYSQIGVTPDGKQIVTLQKSRTSSIWTGDAGQNSKNFREITSEIGNLSPVAVTTDGKIIFRSFADGKSNLWQIGPGSEDRKQITTDGQVDFRGICVMPNTEKIIFPSWKTGKVNLWSVDINGNNLKQLTFGNGEYYPGCSPDNRTVIYQQDFGYVDKSTLWKISLDGGEPIRLTEYSAHRPALSPDGRQIAFFYLTDDRWRIGIVSSNGGAIEQGFDVPEGVFDRIVRWSPDRKSLLYAVNSGGVGNVWRMPLDGQPPRQITDFDSQHLEDFVSVRDGSQLIVIRSVSLSDVVSLSAE